MLISRAEMVWALVVCLKEAGDKKLFEYFTLALIMISLESLGLIDNLNLNFIFHNVRFVFNACDRDHRHWLLVSSSRVQPAAAAKMAGNFALADRAAQDIKKSTIHITPH